MKQICIVALIGLPAVGKTTLSKMLLEIESPLPFNILHINYDNLVNFKTDSKVSYKEQRAELLVDLTSLVESLKVTNTIPGNLLLLSDSCSHYKVWHKEQLLILCDDNHYYRSMRYKLYQMARQFNLSYGQIYFDCPTELALNRNNLRCSEDKVPPEVFQRMSLYLEPPQPFVNEWELNTLILSLVDINKQFILSCIIPFVARLFETPLASGDAVEQEKCMTPQTQLHDLDLIIRKRIGMFLSSKVVNDKKSLAQMLNEKKKIILKEFQDIIKSSEKSDEEDPFEKCVKLFEKYLDSVKE